MTNNDELAMKLKAAAEKVTVLDLDTSQIERGNDGYYECPVCCGLGEVEAETDFCNIDGVALGVQFYGIGEHHGAAEEYFRTVAPANILALLAERDADKKRMDELEESLEKAQSQSSKWLDAYHKAVSVGARYEERIAELESRTVSVKWPDDGMDDCYDLWGAEQCRNNFDCGYNFSAVRHEQAIREALAAAGIKMEVGE